MVSPTVQAEGPGRGDRHHLALHEPAGGILRKREAFLHEQAVGPGQGRQDPVLDLLVEVLEDLHPVVAVQLRERLGEGLGPYLLDHLLAHQGVQVAQHRGLHEGPLDVEHQAPFVLGEIFQEIGQVGRVERLQELRDLGGLAGLQGVLHRVDQLGGKRVGLLPGGLLGVVHGTILGRPLTRRSLLRPFRGPLAHGLIPMVTDIDPSHRVLGPAR
jgi:hypothetical protein